MKPQRSAILQTFVLAMTLCWLYALTEMLNRLLAQGRLSVVGLLLFYPLAFGVSMVLRRLRWPPLALQIIGWLAWVAALLVCIKFQLYADVSWSDRAWLLGLPGAFASILDVFRPELLILLAGAGLWWLGQRLAYLKPSFGALVTEFQFGMALLVITLVVNAVLGDQPAGSIAVALLFFVLSLLGMSLAHAMDGAGWLSGVHRSQWSVLLLASTGGVLAAGVLIALIVTPGFLHLAVEGVKWVGSLLLAAAAWLLDLLPRPSPSELPPMTPTPNMEPAEGYQLWSMPETVRTVLQIAMAVLWTGLILLALWRVSTGIAAWLRRRLAGRGSAEFESMPGAFRADLLGWLKRVLSSLLGLGLLFRHRRAGIPVMPGVASVRNTYSQLLRWAASGGWPRQAWQTPHEYQQTLAGALPASHEDLAFITQEYVGARYGPATPSREQLRRLDESWHRIRRTRLKKPKVSPPDDRRPEPNGQSD